MQRNNYVIDGGAQGRLRGGTASGPEKTLWRPSTAGRCRGKAVRRNRSPGKTTAVEAAGRSVLDSLDRPRLDGT